MSISPQTIRAGELNEEWKHQLSILEKNQIIARFWKQDLSLWPFYTPPKDEGKGLLNWLALAHNIGPTIAQISRLGDSLEGKGFTDVVFLAVSSSSLAAESVTSFSLETRGAKFHTLSLLQPSGLRALERQINFARTVFLVASKSGKNLEMHSLLLYLLAQARFSGLPVPAANFIAITEDGSYLATLAQQDRFRALFKEPHGFRGRFSGVLHYSYLLGGFCKLDAAVILSRVLEMRSLCVPQIPIEKTPAALLAAFFAAMAQCGFDRLVVRASPALIPFAQRIAHLVGSSTCKEEKGIMPFVEADVATPEILKQGCAVLDIAFKKEEFPTTLEESVPSIRVELGTMENIAAEIFKWEIATCLACSLIDVNPFQDPDFGDPRKFAIQRLEQVATHAKFDSPRPRIIEGNLSLFVEGELRQEISTLSLDQALASFFALRRQDAFIGLMNYTWNLPEARSRLASLASSISRQLLLPAQLVTGPWYLHLLDQCYEGGPRGGIFLLLTCDPSEKIEVPGAGYTFGDMIEALAMGSQDSLARRERPVIRVHLSGPSDQALAELEATIGRALRIASKGH